MNRFDGTVRSATSADLPYIRFIIEEWQGDAAEILLSIGSVLAGKKGGRYLVAQDSNGRVVGVMGLATSGIDADLFKESEKVAELVSAYVAHKARGMGAGRALADALEKLAGELGFDKLLVISGSRNRVNGYPFWHQRYGDPVRVDEDYFGPGAERVVWAKDLLRGK